MSSQVTVDRLAIEAPDALAGAEDRAADRLVGPGAGGQEIEHKVVRRVLDRADLLDDDVLLALEFGRVEQAVGQDVAEHVERKADVAPDHAGEVAGPLDAGLGVEVAADVLDRLGDFAGASPARALERHVLEKMRQPVLGDALVTRAGSDEHADGGGPDMRACVGDDGEARRQRCDADVHAGALAVSRRYRPPPPCRWAARRSSRAGP